MSKLIKVVAVLLLSSVIYVSCKHEIPFPIGSGGGGTVIPPPPATVTCSADTVYFQKHSITYYNIQLCYGWMS